MGWANALQLLVQDIVRNVEVSIERCPPPDDDMYVVKFNGQVTLCDADAEILRELM